MMDKAVGSFGEMRQSLLSKTRVNAGTKEGPVNKARELGSRARLDDTGFYCRATSFSSTLIRRSCLSPNYANGYPSRLRSTGASGLIIIVKACKLTIHHFREKERPNVGFAYAASHAASEQNLITHDGRSEVWI